MTCEELKVILDLHKKWLMSKVGGQRADLRYADLRSANLSSADLSSADLHYANLSSANLRSANLRSADLSSANLSSANLSSANLRSANLSSANLHYANLSSADLHSADLSSADLSSANLRSADLSSANLSSANLLLVHYNGNTIFLNTLGVNILSATFILHQVVSIDENAGVGCIFKPLTEWVKHFREIGVARNYTEEEIKQYGSILKFFLRTRIKQGVIPKESSSK